MHAETIHAFINKVDKIRRKRSSNLITQTPEAQLIFSGLIRKFEVK